jgi:acylglycerol lipase
MISKYTLASLSFFPHFIHHHLDVSVYESLSNAGVDIYAYDHHGHGRSGGMPRGYADKFEHYVDDLLDYIQQCQGMYIDRGTTPPPLILMGQSMGGLISVMAALKLGSDKVNGLILTSPALGVDMNLLLTIQKKLSPIINALAPKLRIVDAVRPVDLSRNVNSVTAYINDPLIQCGKTVARTAIVIDKTFDIVKERRHEISCPLLLLHGTDDKATSMAASIDFFRNVASKKKQYLQLRGVFHEIYEDEHTPTFITRIVEFASTGGIKFATIVESVSRGSIGTNEEEKEEDGVIVIDCR